MGKKKISISQFCDTCQNLTKPRMADFPTNGGRT